MNWEGDYLNRDTDFPEIHQICSRHSIQVKDIKPISGSFGKKIFIINQEYLLRLSDTAMTLEQEKFRRVATLNFVPKIVHAGVIERKTGSIYYTLLTFLHGKDFVNAYQETTDTQQKQLGIETACFLDHLQGLTATQYDIGLYIPVLPCFSGTWREGHQNYWEILKKDTENLHLHPDSARVFERAFDFLLEFSAVLDYQMGPKLLHNDFHPANILLSEGKFSGVIDWECSQFGEADFELCHLIHWTLYPPKSDIDFRFFLRTFFEASPKCTQFPHLAQRLTIYQVEHEMQQIIWSAGGAETWRVPRLVRWMDGRVEELFRELGI